MQTVGEGLGPKAREPRGKPCAAAMRNPKLAGGAGEGAVPSLLYGGSEP